MGFDSPESTAVCGHVLGQGLLKALSQEVSRRELVSKDIEYPSSIWVLWAMHASERRNPTQGFPNTVSMPDDQVS